MSFASFRDISSTLCPLNNACAASIIVGVGVYIEFNHLKASIFSYLI